MEVVHFTHFIFLEISDFPGIPKSSCFVANSRAYRLLMTYITKKKEFENMVPVLIPNNKQSQVILRLFGKYGSGSYPQQQTITRDPRVVWL